MGNFDSSGDFNGEPFGNGGLVWGERDWIKYLQQNKADIACFVQLYKQLRNLPNALDTIAGALGWCQEDWYMEFDDDSASVADIESDLEAENVSFEPYTLHRCPAYIATRGLCDYLRSLFLQELKVLGPSGVSTVIYWEFNTALQEAEKAALLALHAEYVGEHALTVCHFKQALTALNTALGLLQHPFPMPLKGDATRILFDLRELWLRLLTYAREDGNLLPPGEDE